MNYTLVVPYHVEVHNIGIVGSCIMLCMYSVHL